MPHVHVNGIGLFYQDLGAPSGQPVVLIMGWGGDHTAWALQMPALAASHRVIALDNRGAGQSDSRTSRTRSPAWRRTWRA